MTREESTAPPVDLLKCVQCGRAHKLAECPMEHQVAQRNRPPLGGMRRAPTGFGWNAQQKRPMLANRSQRKVGPPPTNPTEEEIAAEVAARNDIEDEAESEWEDLAMGFLGGPLQKTFTIQYVKSAGGALMKKPAMIEVTQPHGCGLKAKLLKMATGPKSKQICVSLLSAPFFCLRDEDLYLIEDHTLLSVSDKCSHKPPSPAIAETYLGQPTYADFFHEKARRDAVFPVELVNVRLLRGGASSYVDASNSAAVQFDTTTHSFFRVVVRRGQLRLGTPLTCSGKALGVVAAFRIVPRVAEQPRDSPSVGAAANGAEQPPGDGSAVDGSCVAVSVSHEAEREVDIVVRRRPEDVMRPWRPIGPETKVHSSITETSRDALLQYFAEELSTEERQLLSELLST